jgi:orotate phosphoribosyltransferase
MTQNFPKTFTALSVVAPAGERIRAGEKRLEIRRWKPDTLPLRDLLIVQNRHRLSSRGLTEDPDGVALALVDVVGVHPWREDEIASSCATVWEPGWLAWELANVRPLVLVCPTPARLRLYPVTVNFETQPHNFLMVSRPELSRAINAASRLQGVFTLRSGVTAGEYFDKYRFESDPALLHAIARHLAERIPQHFDALAGLEMGGIPIATVLSQITRKPTLFIRKQAKDYGTCRFAEGGEVSGRRLLIVEDVVTSGGAILDSVRALRGEGAIIEDVVCVIDREAGGRENLAREGLALSALFTKSQLG